MENRVSNTSFHIIRITMRSNQSAAQRVELHQYTHSVACTKRNYQVTGGAKYTVSL